MYKKLVAGLGLMIFLGACAAEMGSISRVRKGPVYDRSVVQYAIRDGNMLTTFHADLTGLEGASPAAVANGLQTPPWFSPAVFVPASPSAAVDAHRVVFLLNPSELTWSGRHLCAAVKPLATKPTAANSVLVAALCSGDRVISEVRARMPAKMSSVAGLTAFLNAVIAELLPRKEFVVPTVN